MMNTLFGSNGGEMKEKPVNSMWTDEQWHAIAIRNTNTLVSAGAGSGKTAVLSERVLELVREGVNVTQLIVLTFTNAAASEMKARIRKKLLENSDDNEHILNNALQIDNGFITTFDSYCLFLVKKYHYLLNISKNVAIIDNASISKIKNQLIHQLLNEYVENDDCAVIEFLKNYATNAQEIEKLLIDWHNKYKQDMNPQLQLEPSEIFAQFEAIIWEQLAQIKSEVFKLCELAAETNMPQKIEERLANLLVANDYDQLKPILDVVFETRLWTIPRTDFDGKEEAKVVNDSLKKNLKSLHQNVKHTRAVHYQLIERNNCMKQVIEKIICEFDSRVMSYKRQQGLFEFIDINLLAIQILNENEQIRNQLANSVYEIMIDEYQDTNDIQECFVNLIANQNVYMVGDVKQSIYGFRNANPSLFSAKFNAYKQSDGGELITLTNNFRSRSSVLKQVNDLFGVVMDSTYGGIDYDQTQVMKYGNKTYDLLSQTNDNEIICYDKEQVEINCNDYEIMQIFRDIKNKLNQKYMVVDDKVARPVLASDFAIICSTRSQFERIVQIGQYYGVAVNADINQKFVASSEISVIQSVFNICHIRNCGNDGENKLLYSILQLARSYLFNFTDEQIDQTLSKLKRIDNNQVEKVLYALSKSELAPIINKLERTIKNIDLKSLQTITDHAIADLAIIENLHRLDNPLIRQLRLQKLSELMSDFDKRNLNLQTACQYLNEIEQDSDLDIEFSAGDDAMSDSVHVITTHKSKGLEYNICYFPFLNKLFNFGDINSRYGYSFKHAIVMPAIAENGNLQTTIEKTLYSQSQKSELISEKIRLLYVALTRAKDKNILIFDRNKLDNNKLVNVANARSLNDIIANAYHVLSQYERSAYDLSKAEQDASKYNTFEKSAELAKVENGPTYQYEQLQTTRKEYTKKRASKQITNIVDQQVIKNIKRGNDLHEKLEFINLLAIDEAIDNAEGDLKKVLSNIKASNLLAGAINYYSEFQFTDNYDERQVQGIIDLLIECADCYIIVDYKLNDIEKAEYTTQVQTYINYIQKMTNKRVEGYLLSLISGTKRQVTLDV